MAQDGGVIHTTDSGETWELQPTNTHNDLLAVHSCDSKDVWVVGTYGTILHSTDGGKNWNVKSESTSEPLAGVDVSPTGRGWAVGRRELSIAPRIRVKPGRSRKAVLSLG